MQTLKSSHTQISEKNIFYRDLAYTEITRTLFKNFIRRQVVNKCRRKIGNTWIICEDPFVDDWTEENYQAVILQLRQSILAKGFVHGAFICNKLKGFVCVEPQLFGSKKQYLDLSNLHVSEDMRGHGIGKTLFLKAQRWAHGHGAKKLYISAHSAIESQIFYQKMGCVEAKEYSSRHVTAEPFDCQLEYDVSQTTNAPL